MLNDHTQRSLATDPSQSFIVQAPAGSGKTEILTQRYLRLLATVTSPEQIVALTFTRKAANEMRERIVRSLHRAAAGHAATSAHQHATNTYAGAALARDRALDWQLLQQPGRLRIFTIDALCQQLTQAIPLQEKQIPYAQISDRAPQYYLAASRACLRFTLENEDYHPALKLLLTHLDNSQERLVTLFSDLLSKRDQWLQPLHEAKIQDKTYFEHALSWIEEHELARFYESVPLACQDELTELARLLAEREANRDSPRDALRHWHHFAQLNRQLSASLATLLLTSQDTLRKAFDHHVGLKRKGPQDREYDFLKTASKNLLEKLAATPDFLTGLVRVKNLPAPYYAPGQWQVLQALFTLLPLLAAHLQLIFSKHNAVDFTAIAAQSLQALGEEDSPSDLALYLDNQIHHLLVDEFQDTSLQQFNLLTKLVQGWQPGDGKTLFVVGDPMQSIYRFRAAEVGLFLRAQRQGIGPIALLPLELSCNFRSTATIVDWVNKQFKSIFPQHDDIESGAVSFHPSQNSKSTDNSSFVQAFYYPDAVQEACAVVNKVREALQAYPDNNIAILVRSRRQLTEITRILREQQIPCQGIEIDLLAKLPHLRDVWTITQALLMPANRLAWLALLRSPWCGISLVDLHCIANFEKKQSIYSALMQLEKIINLSDEGRIRAHFVFNVLQTALINRHQQPLVESIANTLNALHLEKVLDSNQQDDLEQFWLLIEKYEQDGQIAELELFKNELNTLYSQKVTPSRLQIMTIHKSKGLEFDSVILPGLSAKPPRMDTPLLRWLKLPTQQGSILLLSPIKAMQEEHCLLYDYLGNLEQQKNNYELQRLLYVAVTRAKKRLYLFDNQEKESAGTFRYLLQNQPFLAGEVDNTPAFEEFKQPKRYYLPLALYQQPCQLHAETLTMSYPLTGSTPRLIGLAMHELLQWICDHHPQQLHEIPWQLATYYLKSQGFIGEELTNALALIQNQLERLFQHDIGRWLIKKHDDERNEYALLIENNGEAATRIIDRTFLAQGTRWVVDFKTGRDGLLSEEDHRQQVNQYACYLTRYYSEPFCCGLYYLATGHWVSWEYSGINEVRPL